MRAILTGELSAVSELASAVNRVEANVRGAVPEARVMYIEPDVVGTGLPADPLAPSLASHPPRVHAEDE